MRKKICSFFCVLGLSSSLIAQQKPTTEMIAHEAINSSQLEFLAHELMDVVGGRLVGSPSMQLANDWVVATYKNWGISATNEKYGEWKGWERGNTTLEMTSPRKQQLTGRQLAWTVNMKKPVEAEVMHISAKSAVDFSQQLAQAKGKIILVGPYQPSGRPEAHWKEFATEADYQRYLRSKDSIATTWNNFVKDIAGTQTKLIEKLEEAGAAGIVINGWTGITGSNRVFDAKTKNIPQVDMNNEDWCMLYRLSLNGKKPRIKLQTESKHLGAVPIFNTIAVIPGTTKKDEYIMLSAHLDAWDGGQGATDNGTGTILMMEVARIIQKLYPNPARTIIIGHWNSEEQGLNGSAAYVEDHPEIIQNLKVLFNQDAGTGRITSINGNGFIQSYDYLGRWLDKVPDSIRKHITTTFPGMPQKGGTDNASFIAAGVPAFNLGCQNWGYGPYTWHTNLDTYDKIVFEEVLKNVITTAILTIEAASDPADISNERRVMPTSESGETQEWPPVRKPNRRGRLD